MNNNNKRILLLSPKKNAIFITIYLILLFVIPSLIATYLDKDTANNIRVIMYIVLAITLTGTVLQYFIDHFESTRTITEQAARINIKVNSRKIFVVHGHDEEAKQPVARVLEKLGFEAVILHEQANRGKTIIEKFEHYSDVGFAVILLTPDDLGNMRSKPEELNQRARQNVILELGYFIGKLGRARVCALYKGSVELPSDLHGVLYVSMDDDGSWKYKLAREMKAVGLDVDMNKI